MSNMSKYNNFIKNWAVISIATCIFSYLLWALMDFNTFVDTGITIEDSADGSRWSLAGDA